MEDNADLQELLKGKRPKRVNSRTKGNAFERKIANLLNETLGTTEFCRSPGSGAFATVHKLPEHLNLGGDLLTPKDFPFLIECKKGYDFKIADLLNDNSKFLEIIQKLEKESTKHFKEPLLIFQQDRKQILCVINRSRIKDFNETVNFKKYTILSFEKFLILLKSYYTS